MVTAGVSAAVVLAKDQPEGSGDGVLVRAPLDPAVPADPGGPFTPAPLV